MDNAVIYARFSSSKQQEQSIDGQLRYCREYAARCGYKVVGEYCDRAISGTTDARPDFQRMIADAKKKKFDYVIVWKLDRFSRDRYVSAMYKHELKKNGVKVLSATEGIGEGDESVILEAILEAMAEMYIHQLRQNVVRGLREGALSGRQGTGTVAYGYRLEDKRLVIEPDEAAVVKYVFAQYAQGVLKSDIAEALNARGARTRRGEKFRPNSFQTMLKNKKYIGIYHWSDIEIEDGCPALIDRETFDKCQRRLELNRRKTGRRSKVEYLLKGKLFCGPCGAPMTGDSGTGKHGDRFYYYTCSRKKNQGADSCGKRRERKDFVEWYVVEQSLLYILQSDRLDYVSENVVKKYNETYDNNKLSELQLRKTRLEREYQKLADSFINATSQRMIDTINDKAAAVEAQLNELDEEIELMEVGCDVALTKDDVKLWLSKFCDGDACDKDFQRRIIDVLVNAVYLYDDKIVIYFNVRSGAQISYIEMLDDLKDHGIDPVAGCSRAKPNEPPFNAKRRYHDGISFLR